MIIDLFGHIINSDKIIGIDDYNYYQVPNLAVFRSKYLLQYDDLCNQLEVKIYKMKEGVCERYEKLKNEQDLQSRSSIFAARNIFQKIKNNTFELMKSKQDETEEYRLALDRLKENKSRKLFQLYGNNFSFNLPVNFTYHFDHYSFFGDIKEDLVKIDACIEQINQELYERSKAYDELCEQTREKNEKEKGAILHRDCGGSIKFQQSKVCVLNEIKRLVSGKRPTIINNINGEEVTPVHHNHKENINTLNKIRASIEKGNQNIVSEIKKLD